MGDRGNIIIKERDYEGEVRYMFFYSHWTGYKLPKLLQEALIKGKSRWGDDSYLNRIIFQTMLEDNNDVTGYGLSTDIGDNEYNFVMVNHHDSQVELVLSRNGENGDFTPVTAISFDDYIQLDLGKEPWEVLNKMLD